MNNCFCAMFDIIGFTNLLKEKGSEGLYQLYRRSILPMIQHSAMPRFIIKETNGINIGLPDPKSKRAYYSFFSDTIIFYSKDESFGSFIDILFTSLEFLKSGFCGSRAPYRGAIGYGDIISDSVTNLIGTSVVDAYKGMGSQMWAGCILTETCEKFCNQKKYFDAYYRIFGISIEDERDEKKSVKIKKAKNTLVKYKVPKQKQNYSMPIEYYKQEHFVLDWTQKVYEGAAEKSFNPCENSHQEKIRNNTVDFEKWARLNNTIE